jgi:hypothetical protein
LILQFRLIQQSPINSRSSWSIEQFHIFHIHSHLQWFKNSTKLISTFIKLTNSTNEILYETKDVYFNLNYIFQIEFNSTNLTNHVYEYSDDFGLTWMEISNEDELKFIPMKFQKTFYRLTIPFHLLLIQNNSIRFRFKCKEHHLHYIYIGNKCPMNCYGNTYCDNGECKMMNSTQPLVCKNSSSDFIKQNFK